MGSNGRSSAREASALPIRPPRPVLFSDVTITDQSDVTITALFVKHVNHIEKSGDNMDSPKTNVAGCEQKKKVVVKWKLLASFLKWFKSKSDTNYNCQPQLNLKLHAV